jgi:hypothetical protein
MTNKSRTIFRSVRLFGSGRDARTRGRFQRVISGDATASPNVSFALRRGAFCVPADWPNQILQRVPIRDDRAGIVWCEIKEWSEAKPLIENWAENVLMYLVGKFKTVKAAHQAHPKLVGWLCRVGGFAGVEYAGKRYLAD